MEPDTLWVAVSPGVMELPTTKFCITFERSYGGYILAWNGTSLGEFRSLQKAKDGAAERMVDMIEMGIEV